MQKLSITNFSCIKAANITTSNLTLFIGPQASGKSVISKLIYFFNEAIINLPLAAEERLTSRDLEARMKDDFEKWFPPSAWGNRIFQIRFEHGPFSIQVKRRGSARTPINKIDLKISLELLTHYEVLDNFFRYAFEGDADQSELSTTRPWRVLGKVQREHDRILDEILEGEHIRDQIFVPAGRSWFTSIGKGMGAFEYSGLLDPATLSFGRLYTNARERNRAGLHEPRPLRAQDSRLMMELFGGEIRFERDREFVETIDGRKIPFNVLSSGQQEVLPLWLVVSQLRSFPAIRREFYGSSLIFIEEPEAHLFPTAQSILLDYLVSMVASGKGHQKMVLTTHSPYVLTKINNLLKAGELGMDDDLASRVESIIPRRSWLRAEETTAYAIIEGKVVSIMDPDGMIDGEYLDEVSGELSRTFNKLLDVEYDDV